LHEDRHERRMDRHDRRADRQGFGGGPHPRMGR
jgi:hypothetical protein